MDLWAAVDIYCERTSAAFWAEPLNALSNLSFVLAAAYGAWTARRRGVRDWELWLLIGMAAVIGLGSFLFHTLAVVWSGFADTIPIWSFVAVFVLVAIHRIGGVAPGKIAVGLVVAIAAITVAVLASGEGSAGAPAPNIGPNIGPDPFNGSLQYAPAVVALVAFSVIARLRRHPQAGRILAATGVFFVSLCFRTLDRDICAAFPLGTHFLWHILNGVMIAILLQMILRSDPPAKRAG
ncbi:MAG: hypothetical protein EBU97_02790 [Rhodobacteraceae bacterium]|nr:hypothetical protein [Paracoccaceae bacterium]